MLNSIEGNDIQAGLDPAIGADAELICGEAASLSLNHVSIEAATAATPDLPFQLSGSQRKTAYALEFNVARMIEEAGLENIGFLTLTVGDLDDGKFRQVWNAKEASRRINSLATNFLGDLFKRWVIVTERHKSGAIHFHLIVQTSGDIRSGFDFAAFKRGSGYADSASALLRSLWAILRGRLPAYGFGRSELAPIYANGEAISRYVSKYVEKNLFNRLPEDKGKKLVRYHGFNGTQLTANKFGWCTPRAAAWRAKAAKIAGMVGAKRNTVQAAFGPRWSFKLTRLMHAFNESANTDRSQDLRPLAFPTYPERFTAKQIIRREVNRRWLHLADCAATSKRVEWRIAA